MKNFLLAACIFILIMGSAQADQINLTVTYDGEIYGSRPLGVDANAISKLTDGYFPVEGVWDYSDANPLPDRWNGANTVTFYGDGEIFNFDLGGTYLVEDVALSADNNDKYYVEYLSGSSWVNLFTLFDYYGEIGGSMDTFSTDPSLTFHGQTEYVGGIDFSAVQTTKLRIYADTSVDTNLALGEFQVFGTAVQVNHSPTPEPATMLLFGLGLLGLTGISRRKQIN